MASPVTPPLVWLATAGVLELAGLALALFAEGDPRLSVAGWVLGGFVAIAVLAWYTVVDSQRRADPWYSSGPAPGRVRTALTLGAVLVVTLNSLRFAQWASRQWQW